MDERRGGMAHGPASGCSRRAYVCALGRMKVQPSAGNTRRASHCTHTLPFFPSIPSRNHATNGARVAPSTSKARRDFPSMTRHIGAPFQELPPHLRPDLHDYIHGPGKPYVQHLPRQFWDRRSFRTSSGPIATTIQGNFTDLMRYRKRVVAGETLTIAPLY
jgi:hypothetical protein